MYTVHNNYSLSCSIQQILHIFQCHWFTGQNVWHFSFWLPIHRCRVTTLSLCHVMHRLLNGLGGLDMRRLLDDVTLGCWCWHHSGLGLLLLDGTWVRGISNTLVRRWNKYCAIQLRFLESCIQRWQCSVQQCIQAPPSLVHPVYTFVFNVESWWVIFI